MPPPFHTQYAFLSKHEKHFMVLISLTIFVLAFLMNHFTARIGDDYGFTLYPHGTDYTFPLLILDAIKKAYCGYFNSEPAFFMRIFEKIFCTVPKFYANFANAIMLTTLCYLVYRHINAHKASNPFIYLTSTCVLMLTTPLTSQSMFWLAGSFSYLWPITFALLFLLPYRVKDASHTTKLSILLSLGMLVLGIVAGMGHGGAGPLCCSISLGFIILWHYKKQNPPCWAYTGFLGACIGFSFYFFSPANAIRMDSFKQTEGLSYISLFVKKMGLIVYNGEAILFILCLLFFIYLIFEKKKFSCLIKTSSTIYILSTFATAIAMCFTPFAVRSLLFFSTFLTIASLIIFLKFSTNKDFNKILTVISIALSILYLSRFTTELYFAKDCKFFTQQCEDYTLSEKAKGHLHIKLPSIQNHYAYLYLYRHSIMNGLVLFPHYFGIEKVDTITLPLYSKNPVELSQKYSVPSSE